MRRRVLAFLLAVVTAIGMMPAVAMADEDEDARVVDFTLTLRADATPLVIGYDDEEDDGYWYSEYSEEYVAPEDDYYVFSRWSILSRLESTVLYSDGTTDHVSKWSKNALTYDCSTWEAGGSNNWVSVTCDGITRSVSMPVTDFAHLAASSPALSEGVSVASGLAYGSDPARYYFSFTPSSSGYYDFALSRDTGLWARVRTLAGNSVGYSMYANGDNVANAFLEANTTYIVLVEADEAVPFQITVRRQTDVIALRVAWSSDAAPLAIGDTSIGSWRERYSDGEDGNEVVTRTFWFDSRAIYSRITATAYLADGTSQSLDPYDLDDLDFDQSTWQPGADNRVTASYRGFSATFSVPVVGFDALVSGARPLALGSTGVTLPASTACTFYKFTPSASGEYRLYSSGLAMGADIDDEDEEDGDILYAYLYDASGELVDYNFDEEGGGTDRIWFERNLDAGATYYLGIRSNWPCSFNLAMDKLPAISGISAALRAGMSPLVIGDTSMGSWRTYYTYGETGDVYDEEEGEWKTEHRSFSFSEEAVLSRIVVIAWYSDGTPAREIASESSVPGEAYSCDYSSGSWVANGRDNIVDVWYRGKSAQVNMAVAAEGDVQPPVNPVVPTAPGGAVENPNIDKGKSGAAGTGTDKGKGGAAESGTDKSKGSGTGAGTPKKAKITAKTVSKTVKAAAVKKKARSFSMGVKSTSGGKLSYKVTKRNSHLTFNKGKVTVKKGTKRGTYKMKVAVTSKAKGSYAAASKTFTLTFKVIR